MTNMDPAKPHKYMITRREVKRIIECYGHDAERDFSVTISASEFITLATAALKARYIHINKKADADPLYECGMDYLEEVNL